MTSVLVMSHPHSLTVKKNRFTFILDELLNYLSFYNVPNMRVVRRVPLIMLFAGFTVLHLSSDDRQTPQKCADHQPDHRSHSPRQFLFPRPTNGTVIVETEGTNESLAKLQDRCGLRVFPPKIVALIPPSIVC